MVHRRGASLQVMSGSSLSLSDASWRVFLIYSTAENGFYSQLIGFFGHSGLAGYLMFLCVIVNDSACYRSKWHTVAEFDPGVYITIFWKNLLGMEENKCFLWRIKKNCFV